MSNEHVSLPDLQPTLRVVPTPADVNPSGDIFGGWVMAQVDIAGGIPAMRRARGRVALTFDAGLRDVAFGLHFVEIRDRRRLPRLAIAVGREEDAREQERHHAGQPGQGPQEAPAHALRLPRRLPPGHGALGGHGALPGSSLRTPS